jgi:hydrogenase maturation protease
MNTQSKQKKTLVLGLGNDIYGDDGIGNYVVERLSRESHLFPSVDFVPCTISGLALLDFFIGYDNLIIVDTIKRENPVPGTIHVLDAMELRHIPGPSPHYVSIPQTIEIGRQAGLKVPSSIEIVAVEAKNMYQLGEGLSDEMLEALPEIMNAARDLIMKRIGHDKKRNSSS